MKFIWICLFFFLTNQLQAQLSGRITDSNGESLAYATIYISGTSKGTASNLEGYYALKTEPGTHHIRFQYVGYQSQSKVVTINEGEKLELDIQLSPESISLQEIVVSANAEDPAYRIIREAIKKRQFYLEQIKSYKAKTYVKGLIKMFDAPEKFMGVDIGNMEGILDTNRQGILYLSESESILYYKHPNQYREEMISSIVSGDDQGFSFNQASAVNFNFYNQTERFGRKLISPIASNALQFYRFELIGVHPDQDGRKVNKIRVIPKRETDPSYFGIVYITEDLWNLQQVDLGFTSKSVNQNFFDTLKIKQVHVPVGTVNEWSLFSQIIEFNAKIFAFKFGGSFTSIFSDYEINLPFENNVFSGEIMKIEAEANKRDNAYWEEKRPVPLTPEEVHDYIRKDSLQTLWESEEYLDSIDSKNNRFKLMNLLFGYSYNQSFKHRNFQYNSPISSFQFNPVQGSVLAMDLSFRQEYDEERKYFEINSKIQYGFSDQIFRPSFKFEWIPENIHESYFELGIGRKVSQINKESPVWVNLNTWTSLFGKNNLLKLFDKKYIELAYKREISNGLRLGLNFAYELRSPLENSSNYSFFKKEENYEVNVPDNVYFETEEFRQHNAFIFELNADIIFKQKYISHPEQRFRVGSKYPRININYQKGISALVGETDYDKLSLSVYDRRIEIGRFGYMGFRAQAGWMIRKKVLEFIDFSHFIGNELHVTGMRNHHKGFLNLPNYQYSTDGSYVSLIVEQHFEGLLMDRVPFFKHWSWETVFGLRYLYQKKDKRYLELSGGIENISIGPVTLFRFDYVWSLENGNLVNHGPVFSLNRLLTEVLD